MKRLVLGARAQTRSQSNSAVEWRLIESGGPATASVIRALPRRPRRASISLFALAAMIELVLLLGAIYSVRAHVGHGHHETADAAMTH